MKLCIAQTKPVTGDIPANIHNHEKFVELAVANGAGIIIFPELSITGYEPGLAKQLATAPQDERFNEFQQLSDVKNIIIGIGVPTKNENGICITMVLFHPGKATQTYSKKYLHADEEPFFVSGENAVAHIHNHPNIALAICYELSVPAHSADAFKSGAKIYIASVAKTPEGVKKAIDTLSGIAKEYSMTVLLCNAIGPADGGDCGGRSCVLNKEGVLAEHLDDATEGIIIMDTTTGTARTYSLFRD